MISKFDGCSIAVLAVLFCATTAFAQENRGTPETAGRLCARRIQVLQQLHSRSHRGRALPEAEQVRSQRGMPIGVRAKRRARGRQGQIKGGKEIKNGYVLHSRDCVVFGIGFRNACVDCHRLGDPASQGPRPSYLRATSQREELYKSFIEEASRLYADALVNDKSEVSKLVDLYALIARMKILSSDAVIEAAEKAGRLILETYLSPNRTFVDLPELIEEMDPLRDFSEACRRELQSAHRR